MAPRSSSEKPPGKVGNARSRGTPASSQCPVVVSLPGLVSAMRPKAASGQIASGNAFTPAMLPRPRESRRGASGAPTVRQMESRV